MQIKTLDSLPDAGRFTRISVESTTGTITRIDLYESGTIPKLLYPLPLSTSSTILSKVNGFSIQFTKFDLTPFDPTDSTKPKPNQNFLGAVEYKNQSATNPVITASSTSLSLKYTVPAQIYQPPQVSGSDPLANQLGPFDNITVTIIFRQAPDAGWIDLDLQFTYPSQIHALDPVTAWEMRLICPELLFDDAAMTDYTILNPADQVRHVGPFKDMAVENKGWPMPVQFAAVYKLSTTSARVKRAEGVALAATDENGHEKEFHYWPQPGQVGMISTTNLNFQLRGPIHLKGGKFVRAATYTLSGGDDLGFGGARMTYRIRAFQIDGACADAPVDWFDVADLYRKWVRTRTATIFRKDNTHRQTSAPIDNMSPYTIVSNYAIDGPVSPQDDHTDLPKWLEVHPIILPATLGGGGPDVPGNTNESLTAVLLRIQSLFSPNVRLEAQVWGFEFGGYYRFLGGLPPMTNKLNPAPNSSRFKNAMKDLWNHNIIPIITTDPLHPNFDRKRFRGHLIVGPTGVFNGPFIGAKFPQAMTDALSGKVLTSLPAIGTDPATNRTFKMNPDYPDAKFMKTQGKLDWRGSEWINTDVLSPFYGLQQYNVCPTPWVEGVYLDTWLLSPSVVDTPNPVGLLNHGARLIEFMKHHYGHHFCYDHQRHQHLLDPRPAYDNVIGTGAWYVHRMQHLLAGVHDRGEKVYPSFALSNEFAFAETLVPYFDEFYDGNSSSDTVYAGDSRSLELLGQEGVSVGTRRIPFFRYIYSEKVCAKMNTVDNDILAHPGYTEQRKSPNNPVIAEPTYMTKMVDPPIKPTPAYVPPYFGEWFVNSALYQSKYFDISQPGIAPMNYPYSYSRCLQDVMNLRSKIFHVGAAAVLGERIILPAAWIDRPYDYNEELIKMTVRAANMQMFFMPYFRFGYMLGPIHFLSGQGTAHAWRIGLRNFADVPAFATQLNNPADISDKISRATDRESASTAIKTDKIQHMVWQTKYYGNQTRTLYVFANVGNIDTQITFEYSRGLAGAASWNKVVFRFGDNYNPAPESQGQVHLKDPETISIPARGLAGFVLFP